MGDRRSDKNNRTIATNRRARRDYAIEQIVEAGLVLQGSEVKSLRAGRVNFADGHVESLHGELYLVSVHIHEYVFAHRNNHAPMRPRKLLLHRPEIKRMAARIDEKGYTAVPLRIYLKEGRIKVEIGVGKGKRKADRRLDLKERDAERDMARALKER